MTPINDWDCILISMAEEKIKTNAKARKDIYLPTVGLMVNLGDYTIRNDKG